MKVLNYTGLQNLWTNIKNYITAHTPTKTSDLTNDAGFLTSTDISSKANDSEVLHKAQNETVTGEKTFKKDVKIIDLNANERPGVQFEVNGTFRTFEQAEDSLPDNNSGGGIGIGTNSGFSIGGLSSVWSGFVLEDNVKLQNSMSDYVINDITFGTTHYSSVIELNNYFKVYEETDDIQTDLRGMLRFELSPYANVEKGDELWSNPNLYFYAMLDGESGNTILGHEKASWSKAYIDEIICSEIKFGGVISIFDVLATKANSADLATVATSGSYTDLSNKPTINDSTITIQKNGSTVDTFTTNGSAKTINIPIPTKTSDLTNDSNFVDTSNSAVASGITSAKVTSYDSHIADTDIHVTTADKTKWNNGVSQSYVLRYSSTAITNNSTIAYSTLDNTDNIKASDKIIDSDGKIFSIVSVDTTNQTVTVGSALIDLALDANVVHTSGNETISGNKTFNGDTRCEGELNQNVPFKMTGDTSFVTGTKNSRVYDQNGYQCANEAILYNNNKNIRRTWILYNNSSGATVSAGFNFILSASGQKVFYPVSDSDTDNGSSSAYWKCTYSKLINGLTPSSLGMPNLANVVDISGYVTDLTGVPNEYTPTVNGWICVRSADATEISILDANTSIGNNSVSSTATYLTVITPCIANRKVNINIVCTTLGHAYFIPCQGNV